MFPLFAVSGKRRRNQYLADATHENVERQRSNADVLDPNGQKCGNRRKRENEGRKEAVNIAVVGCCVRGNIHPMKKTRKVRQKERKGEGEKQRKYGVFWEDGEMDCSESRGDAKLWSDQYHLEM